MYVTLTQRDYHVGYTLFEGIYIRVTCHCHELVINAWHVYDVWHFSLSVDLVFVFYDKLTLIKVTLTEVVLVMTSWRSICWECLYNDNLVLTRTALPEDVSVMTIWHTQKMQLYSYSWNVDIMIIIIRCTKLQTNLNTWNWSDRCATGYFTKLVVMTQLW